jgi:hypothetical protein
MLSYKEVNVKALKTTLTATIALFALMVTVPIFLSSCKSRSQPIEPPG